MNSLQFVNGLVQVMIGGTPAPVRASLSAQGFVGLTQLNVLVPPAPPGPAMPVELTFRGIAPNQAKFTLWITP